MKLQNKIIVLVTTFILAFLLVIIVATFKIQNPVQVKLNGVTIVAILFIFTLLILLIVFTLRRFIFIPLRDVKKILLTQDSEKIKVLKLQKNEFGAIAGLLEQYVERQKKLETEIENRKKNETALIDSEAKFHSLVDNSLAGTYIIENNRIIYCNQRFAEQFGRTVEEILALETLAPIISPGDVAKVYEAIDKRQRGETNEIYYSFWGVNKDTSRVHLNVLGTNMLVNGKMLVIGTTIDITKFTLALDQLRESEAMYRTIFENTGAASVIFDENTLVLHANSELERISGFLKEEIEGKKSWIEIVVPEDLARLKSFHQERRKVGGNAPHKYEFSFFDRIGNRKTVIVSVSLIPGTKKSIASLIEITDQKIAIVNLEKESYILNSIINHNPLPIQIVDSLGTTIRTNKAYNQLFEIKDNNHNILDDTILAKNDFHYIFNQVLEGEIASLCDVWYNYFDVHKTGANKDVCLRINLFPVKNKLDQTDLVVLVYEDITSNKKYQESLVKQERYFRTIIENSPTIISVFGLNDNCLYISPVFANIYNFNITDFLGRDIRQLTTIVHPSDAEMFLNEYYRVMKAPSGTIGKIIYRILLNSGEYGLFQSFICNYSNKESINGAVIHTSDINFDIEDQRIINRLLDAETSSENINQIPVQNQPNTFSKVLLDATLQAVILLDSDFKVLIFNKTAKENIYSIWKKEIKDGDDIVRYLPLNKINLMIENLTSALNGNTLRFEDKFVYNDNNIRWYEIILTPVYNAQKIEGISFTFIDIYQRKLNEIKIKDSEQRYRTLMENAVDGILLGNQQGLILSANARMCELSGYTPNELSTKNIEILFIKEELILVPLRYDLLSEGKTVVNERKLKRKDGTIITVEMNTKLMTDGTFQSFMRDITERKLIDLELQRFKFILENTTDEFYLTSHEGKMLYVNKSAADSLGYTIDEMLKFDVNVIDNQFDIAKFPAFFELMKQRQRLVMEIKQTTKNHQTLVKEMRLFFLAIGMNQYLCAFGHDITERKEVEKKLIEAKEKAEETDRIKSVFLANISHEIRTPLNGIMGFADLIRSSQFSHDELSEYIEIIYSSSQHLHHIVNDIIDISKIESGKMKVMMDTCDINAIFIEIFTSFKQQLIQKSNKINLQFVKLDIRKSFAITDKLLLAQILTNLIENAFKFTEKGYIKYGCTIEDVHWLKFYVEDTGIGIPEDKFKYIFDSFHQADETSTRLYGGAGLGLAIAQKLLQLLNGQIWLDSIVGQGSTFYFKIPYQPANHVETLDSH